MIPTPSPPPSGTSPPSASDPAASTASAGEFAPTRWTLVLAARGDSPSARAALGELCESYYQPVLGFLRREGRDADAARELAQEFFSRILSRAGFATADPARGRFRSFLLGALRHFLADMRDRERAVRRGSGTVPESLEDLAEKGADPGVAAAPDPAELRFDRAWALALMQRTLDRLCAEFRSQGKQAQFDQLKPWLGGDLPSGSNAQAAAQGGLSGGSLKVAVHRLRRRFRQLIRAEIAHTVPDPSDVEPEFRHLIEVLAHARGRED